MTTGEADSARANGSESLFDTLKAAVEAEEPVALATVVSTEDDEQQHLIGGKLLVRPGQVARGTLGSSTLDRVVARDAQGELSAGTTGIRHYGPEGEAGLDTVAVFIESFAPPPQMVIFGAVDFTAALARIAKVLGYRVTVCDARPVFATKQRFPWADQVVVDWPNRLLEKIGPELTGRDAICVLTHDPKFDIPAITSALLTDVGYLGAMGSRRTTSERNQRLRDVGVTDEQLAAIHAPIGIDLGGRTPEETAVSICAEIIATRSGRTVASLRDTAGDIHR
jgi:xanthine dehydrogenase accessory factor